MVNLPMQDICEGFCKAKKGGFLVIRIHIIIIKGKNIADLPNYYKKFKTKGSTFTKQMDHTRLDLLFFKIRYDTFQEEMSPGTTCSSNKANKLNLGYIYIYTHTLDA
jgi:hypothetical protein